ncbi:DNase I-like protein [Annulohypoxylon bovei var. microspora]|nr:DNase I-like protein [Annulohypoxylon bovei var. microspora]
MSATNREPSIASEPEQVEEPASNLHSLSRAVIARKSEYVRPHRIRIKVGTWNVAGCPGTDKDLASWFVDGKGVEPQLDAKLARLSVSESIETIEINTDHNTTSRASATPKTDPGIRGGPNSSGSSTHEGKEEPDVRLPSGDKIGLYVLGLQEVVDLNIVTQTFYSDPNAIAKWQDALEAALPKGYNLVASEQLVGLLLLIYASPEVAETISNESTVSVGTGIYGLLGYWGNKGAITSRILLGETTRLVFTNSHLASGHDQTSLDRRCWDYNRIMTQTKFNPINFGGVLEDEGEKIGDEDFAFWLGDLNFRLDGLPGGDIRRLLTLHTRGEYDLSKKHTGETFSDDGVIVLRNNDDDDDGTNTPGMISREASFDKDSGDEDSELPDPDDFLPDPNDDPASLQATLNSLLPHDQLMRMIKERKAFHEGWHEGPITFLPTYKYDVGTVGLFDSSEKQRAPSWCDRILYRTRTDVNLYEKKCNDEIEAKKRDEDMKKMGIDKAAEDENVLFDYDPTADSSTDNLGDTTYDYDEYDEGGETLEQVVTKEGFIDRIHLDAYTSHQRVMSSDHKPIVALFTLDYDAVVPELKAKVHAEVAWELDRAENEGRPGLTVIVDAKDSINKDNKHFADGSEGVDFGELGFLRKDIRILTIANTGRVPATFCFIENPIPQNDAVKYPRWLQFKFVHSQVNDDEGTQDSLDDEITLEPGETVNAVIEVHIHDLAHVQALNTETAQLEDVLILRVTDGRDHFIPIKATWIPSCFGRSLEELIRVPRGGGIRALVEQRQKGGYIPNTLEVHKSSPNELFQLTEAIAILAERAIADANMLEEVKIPRDKPGWPFDKDSWQTINDEDHESLLTSMIEALEVDNPVLESIGADVPALKRLEIVSEVLLLFLRSMPDGIITTPLWAKIEQTLPNIGSGKTPAEAEEARSAILDILATAPYYNISFVFLMSMLTRVANELVALSKEALDALNTRRASSAGTLAKRSLSFRRSAGGAVAADQAAILRRLAWERKAAEIFGVAICRAPTSTNPKEKKATEDRMRGVVEVFLRQDRT